MGYSVKEWVERFCATCDDATSLRIMRGRAIGAASVNCWLLEGVKSCLTEDDPWIPEITAQRDEDLALLDKIEARLNELGVPFGNERSYGVSAEDLRRVNEAREKRNG